jgi:hypothetical protein
LCDTPATSLIASSAKPISLSSKRIGSICQIRSHSTSMFSSAANRVAACQAGLGDSHPYSAKAPSGASAMTAGQLLDRVENAVVTLDTQGSLDWTQAYVENVSDKAPLVQRIALAACRLGNDPHNQEIAQCMLMDWGTNKHANRDLLLLSAAYHTAGHRKYGDVQEPSRRFGQAFGYSELV